MRFIYRPGHPEASEHGFVAADRLSAGPSPVRSDMPAPTVIRDIEPYKSMVDGTMITSRSRHRDHLKAHGMVELGNEMPQGPKLETVSEKDIAEAYDQVEAGYHPKVEQAPPEPWTGPIEESCE